MSPALAFVEATPAAIAPRLDAGSIHLWRVHYASSQGRAPLLELLGSYLGKPPSAVVLVPDAHGKPQLAADAPDRRVLQFNWSHSGDYALIALSTSLALGADIERIDRRLRAVELARRFFDPAEAEVLASLPRPGRDHAFIGLWCAKEAVLKAGGEGLSFGLTRLLFEWRSGMDWRLEKLDPALGHTADWQLLGFNAAPGYRGALAWRGTARSVVAATPPKDTASA